MTVIPILRTIHKTLVSNRFTRKAQRQLVTRLKNAMGYSDPFEDLERIVASCRPAAILDIGSHVGKTIARIREFSREIPIHGFEPTPETFERLANRFRFTEDVHLHGVALSDCDGTALMHCNQNEQTNSLLSNGIGNRCALKEATRAVREIEIPTIRLDRWFRESDIDGQLVIKCDVQGAEGKLLDGGRQTFSNHVIAFYSEAQIAPMYEAQIAFDELHRRLTTEFNFELANIYPCFRDRSGKALQTDALWVRSDQFSRM